MHTSPIRHKSTTSSPLQLVDNGLEELEKGNKAGVILLDMSAAFDCMDADILHDKLRMYNVSAEASNWFLTYMRDRSQCVEVSAARSSFKAVNTGVPQGSILGPLLYTIYMNELPAAVYTECVECRDRQEGARQYLFTSGCNSCGCTVAYADDTGHIFGDKCENVIANRMKEIIGTLSKFITANLLKLNEDQTHIMCIMTRQKRTWRRGQDIELDMGGEEPIKPSITEKILGCTLHHNFYWNSHVYQGKDNICARVAWKLGELWRTGRNLSKTSRLLLANGHIMSIIVYACPVWGGLGGEGLDRLQKMQNRAARWILRKGRRTRISELLKECGWLSILQTIRYASSIQMWKTLFKETSTYWNTRIYRETGHSRLRSGADGRIQVKNIPRLDILRNSWRWRAASEWNEFPSNIRTETSISKFKREARKWIGLNTELFKPKTLFNQ